jgi:organic hydroperoxide reductase OsmC/OhrA
METQEFRVDLVQVSDFEFRVRFAGTEAPDLAVDEPPPLGKGHGPNPARLLAAAVGNCLAASLLFCVRKARAELGPINGEAHGTLVRNERGRWRIGSLAVTLKLADTMQSLPALGRCLHQFEDFCIVTESVRRGIPVAVRVVDRDGLLLSTDNTDRNPEERP